MHWKSLLTLIIVVAVYILVGAAIFLLLEQQHEVKTKKLVRSTFTAFMFNNTCVTSDELEAFADFVISSYESGVKASNALDSTRWNYGSAIFYAITVITTIGYGHLSPITKAGQIFFTFYAIIGIPLCATMLVGIGERLARPYMKFDLARSKSSCPKLEKACRVVLFTLVCYAIFSLIPAAVIMHLENWSYLETWYFTVVTLTTVGFGDYVPDQKSPDGSSIYKVIIGLWIFCGLAWVAMVFHMMVFYMKLLPNKVETDAFEVTRVVERSEKESSDENRPLQNGAIATYSSSN